MEQTHLINQSSLLNILGGLDLAIYVQDRITGKIIWANEHFFNFLGKEGDKILGYETDNPIIAEGLFLARRLQEGEIKRIELELSHKEYDTPVRLTIGYLEDKYYFGAIQDISETLELLKALENAGNRSQRLLRSLTAGVIITDSKWNFLFLNQHFAEILGYSSIKDLEGKNLLDFVHPDDHELLISLFKDSNSKGGITDQILVQDETLTWKEVIVSLGLIITSEEENQAVLGIFSDLSEKWHFEKLRKRFIEVTAHELRTPVTVIKGTTDLLIKKLEILLSDDSHDIDLAKQLIETISRNTGRLERLINAVHDYTQIKEGLFQISKESVSFEQFKETMLNDLRSWDYSHRVLKYITFDQHPGSGSFMLDLDKISQAVFNAIENACLHSSDIVQVSCEWQQNGLYISIQDFGEGIPPEFIRAAFEPFTSQMSSFSKGGLGLGLFIMKAIIEKHGGEISINTDNGTLVEIFIPIDNSNS